MQFDLFDEFVPTPKPYVPGLIYVENYIDSEQKLLEAINKEEWDNSMKRRVQHYGYKYDYKARAVNPSMYLGPLPEWSQGVANKLVSDQYFPSAPDQLIINEYLPGQGISNHVDCQPCFSETIVSISLGSACVMNLTKIDTRQVIELYLQPRSLLLLSGDSRYKWFHGITGRLSDQINGKKIQREKRVSLTFRKVII